MDIEKRNLDVWNNNWSPANEYNGWYYKCIFDEENKVLNIEKPHAHLILNSRFIGMPGYIYDGYAFELEGRGLIFTGIRDKNKLLECLQNRS